MEKQVALIIAQQSLKKRQNLVNAFQDDPKIKHLIRLKIIVGTMRLIGTGINLIPNIIVNPKYTLYAKEQAEGRITRIAQIDSTMAHILVCYDVEIERRIKHCYCKRVKMIKGII